MDEVHCNSNDVDHKDALFCSKRNTDYTVLLCESKRHTTHCAASTHSAVLSRGTPVLFQDMENSTLGLGTPCLGLGYPLPRTGVPPCLGQGHGTSKMGYPQKGQGISGTIMGWRIDAHLLKQYLPHPSDAGSKHWQALHVFACAPNSAKSSGLLEFFTEPRSCSLCGLLSFIAWHSRLGINMMCTKCHEYNPVDLHHPMWLLSLSCIPPHFHLICTFVIPNRFQIDFPWI